MVRKLFSISEILSVVVIVLAISIFGAHLFGALEVDGAGCDTEGVWSVGVQSTAWNGTTDTSWYTSNTTASNYVLTTPEQLAGLASLVNAKIQLFSGRTITLANDIDLGGESLKNWVPIGGNSSNQFRGTFDGGEHNISNLYISRSTTDYVGLFGCIYTDGHVKNIHIVSGSVTGSSRVGGVSGQNGGGTVSNCTNAGDVIGTEGYVGGVSGYSGGTVSYCTNTGNVSGTDRVGGVVGYNYYATATNCSNAGSVSGNLYVGGVAGYTVKTVINCSNTGNVSGVDNVGGVVGYSTLTVNMSSTVSNCTNAGNVHGTGSNVGGVNGNSNQYTRNCSNTGSVSGVDNVGGVVGYNSYQSAVGSVGSTTNCSNTGSVSGTGSNVGGVVGYQYSGTPANCEWLNTGGNAATGMGWPANSVGVTVAFHQSFLNIVGVIVHNPNLSVAVDETKTMSNVLIHPSTAPEGTKSMTWTYNPTGIATANNLQVTGNFEGITTITGTTVSNILGGTKGTATVQVQVGSVPVTNVSLNKSNTSIMEGITETLTATISPPNATNRDITWTSSNINIATVSSGTVTGVSAGSATITVITADGGFTASCTVTVSEKPTPPVPPEPPVPPVPPVPPTPEPPTPEPPVPEPPTPEPPVPTPPFIPVKPTEEVKEKIDTANEELKEIGVEIEFGVNPEEIEITALEEIDAEIITTLANMEITIEEKTEGEAMAACYDSLGKSSANFSVSLGSSTQSKVKADEKVQLLPVFYTVTFTKDELTRNVPKGRNLDVNRLLSKPDPDDDALTELFDCYVIQKQITEGKRKGNLARLIGGGKLQLITAVEARRKKVLRVSVVEGVSIKIGFQYFVADGEQEPKYHANANMFVIGDGLKNGKITDPLWMNARKAGVEPPDGGSGCTATPGVAGIVALAILFAVPLIFRKRK